jgi:hypothetical protein
VSEGPRGCGLEANGIVEPPPKRFVVRGEPLETAKASHSDFAQTPHSLIGPVAARVVCL